MVARTTGAAGRDLLILQHLIGKPVRVMSLDGDGIWAIEEPINIRFQLDPYFIAIGVVYAIGDEYLMPIDGLPVDEVILDEVTA